MMLCTKCDPVRRATCDNTILQREDAIGMSVDSDNSTGTLRIFNTCCCPTATMVMRTPFNATFYVLCLSVSTNQATTCHTRNMTHTI